MISSLCGSAALVACVYDDDDRCGANQVIDKGLCRCAQGTTLMQGQCMPIVVPPPPPEMGLGTPCDPATKPCTDATYNSCQTALNGDRYCTSAGCTDSAQCPEKYQCAMGASGSYCRRPYTGQLTPCASSADCAAFDAQACATLLSRCLVRDCPENACDPGFTCFDPATVGGAGLPRVCVDSSVLP